MKTLILIRHAHRDTSARELDNGLSDKGRKQVRHLLEFFEKTFSKNRRENAVYVSSPKKRCRETLTPLAHAAHCEAGILKLLDEQGAGESEVQLFERIEEFVEGWKNGAQPLIVACSHGDWIPQAVHFLTGEEIDLRKCGVVELSLADNGAVELVAVTQEPA